MPKFQRWCVQFLSGLLVVVAFSYSASAEKITVAVSSNFAQPFEVLAADFTKQTGHEISSASGSTGKFFAQIQQGAPFDLFLAADQERPERLAQENEGFRTAPYAQGRLALVQRVGAPPFEHARIGIADPSTAPYGAAAMRALSARGYTPDALDIVNGQNVANVANYLRSGNVDIGFAAASQRFPSEGFTTEILDDNGLRQDMVLLSDNPAAIALFEYLQSPEVQAGLFSLGYLPAPLELASSPEVAQIPLESTSLWPSILLSLQLASITTVILLIIGIPLAWWLTVSKSVVRPVVETLTALPLVVPPTVLGFYLLVLFAPDTFLGGLWVTVTGETLTFSFTGLVVASVIYSLPFAVQPLQTGFQSVGVPLIEAAQSMGASRISLFKNIILPLSQRGVLTAAVLSFAHTIGEFGVVLMVGGNLPGKTRVISIEIFNRVEVLDYRAAHLLAGGLLVFSFVSLLVIYSLNGRGSRHGLMRADYD